MPLGFRFCWPSSTLTSYPPDDLLFATGLEYSGIYEDGWLSPKSQFVLGRGGPNAWIRVRGYRPCLARFLFRAVDLHHLARFERDAFDQREIERAGEVREDRHPFSQNDRVNQQHVFVD